MHSSLKASVVEDRAYARWIIVLSFPYNCVSIFVRFLIISMPIKDNLFINWKLHRKRQERVEAIKSSEKINCSIGAGHSDQGIINISLV